MKKYIVIVLLSFICAIATAQTEPSGFPTQFNTGWQEWGYQQSTKGTIIATRDTSWTPRYCGTMVLWLHSGVDTAYWMWNCVRWKKLSASGDITIAANNGLTKTAGIIQLGGDLTQSTIIGGGVNGYAFQIDSSASISLFSGLEYVSSGVGSFIQMSDSVMNMGASSATDFTSFTFSPTRIKFLPADGAGSVGDVWTNTGSGYGHWSAGGGGGSVTSVSGTANRITVANPTTTPVIDIAATYVGQTSIATLGTIATGVWNGTAIGATFGGTGQTSVTTGDLLYGSASNTWGKLAGVATGNALISGGVTTAPSWGKIGLTTHVSGILPIANGGTATATPSLVAGTNVTITGSWPNQTINAPVDTVFSTYWAYVDTLGSDVTGRLNNPARPFRTVNAALIALPAKGGVIQIGLGTFNSPDSANLKSNVWFRGSGMPVANDTVTVNAYYNNSIKVPTKLIGGTIFNGSFIIPYNREHVHCTDFGVDVGSDWVTNVNGGTEVDGLLAAQFYNPAGGLPSADGKHYLQTQTKPRRGMLFKNIYVLLASATSPYHCFLMENMTNESVDNIYTTYGFAGVVIKTIGGVYTNLHTKGHGTYHIIIKSNDYSYCYGVVVNGFECGPVIGNNGTGLTFDQNDAGSPGVYWCNVSNGFINHCGAGLFLTGDNMNVSNVNIVDMGTNGVVSSNLLKSNVSNITQRISPQQGYDIDPGTVLADGGTTWSNCTAFGNLGDGWRVHNGTAKNYFENIFSAENTGFGFNTNGTAYVGNHTYYSNTAGNTTGTINVRNNDVAEGRTGNTTFTAYALLAGGTTSTGALQQVSGLGTAGQVLTSNGAGALPTFQASAGGTTLYTGDGTLAADRIVTGSGNDLTFNSIFNYRINANSFLLGETSPDAVYSMTISGVNNQYLIGYTPVPTVYSKGYGLYIDTNNNAGLAIAVPTTVPLYAAGNSAYVNGIQSGGGNFYRVNTITGNSTATLANYWFDIDATSGNITVTLPAASTAFGGFVGIQYVFRRVDNSGNTVTISRAGSDTINGATSTALSVQYETKEIQCNSTSTWAIK